MHFLIKWCFGWWRCLWSPKAKVGGVGTVTWGLLSHPSLLCARERPRSERGEGMGASWRAAGNHRPWTGCLRLLEFGPLGLQPRGQPPPCSSKQQRNHLPANSQPPLCTTVDPSVVLKESLHLRQKSDHPTSLTRPGTAEQHRASLPTTAPLRQHTKLSRLPGVLHVPSPVWKALTNSARAILRALAPQPCRHCLQPPASRLPPGALNVRLRHQLIYSSARPFWGQSCYPCCRDEKVGTRTQVTEPAFFRTTRL